jgi:hypothetical protein
VIPRHPPGVEPGGPGSSDELQCLIPSLLLNLGALAEPGRDQAVIDCWVASFMSSQCHGRSSAYFIVSTSLMGFFSFFDGTNAQGPGHARALCSYDD